MVFKFNREKFNELMEDTSVSFQEKENIIEGTKVVLFRPPQEMSEYLFFYFKDLGLIVEEKDDRKESQVL